MKHLDQNMKHCVKSNQLKYFWVDLMHYVHSLIYYMK